MFLFLFTYLPAHFNIGRIMETKSLVKQALMSKHTSLQAHYPDLENHMLKLLLTSLYDSFWQYNSNTAVVPDWSFPCYGLFLFCFVLFFSS